MGLLKVLDYVDRCYTNADGEAIKNIILRDIRKGDKVVLSFKGVDSVSSSFLNTAFIDLLDIYTFEQVKNFIVFTDTSKPINEAIKRRFAFEVTERKKLLGV